MACVFKRLLS